MHMQGIANPANLSRDVCTVEPDGDGPGRGREGCVESWGDAGIIDGDVVILEERRSSFLLKWL